MTIETYVNAVIDSCMAIFCAFAAVYTIVKRKKDPKASLMMFWSLMAGMVFSASEALAFFFDGDSSQTGYVVVRASNLILFLAVFILIIFEMGYLWRRIEVRGGSQSRNLRRLVFIMCGLGILLMILSYFLNFYYGFDEQNRFVPGKVYWLDSVIVYLAFVPMFIQTVRNRKAFHRREYNAFLCLMLLPFACSILQEVLPVGVSLYSIAVSLSVLIVFTVYRRESSEISITREDISFTDETIDQVSEDVESFSSSLEMEKRNRLRLRLIVEEILLRMREKFGEDETFDLLAIINFGRPQIRIEKKGKLFNPLQKSENESSELGGKLLTSIGLNPVFSYSSGMNIVKIPLQRLQMNPALKMLTAMVIGVIAGAVAVNWLSHSDQMLLNDEVLDPIAEIMTKIFYCVAGPILFFMVSTVVLNAVGISDQGGNIISIIVRYFVLSFLMGIIALLFSDLVIFSKTGHLDPGKSHFGSVFDGILSVVPNDIFSPFVEADTPQLLLLAITLSLAVAATGKRAEGLTNIIYQINAVGMKMCEWIGRIIPLFAIVLAAVLLLDGRLRELLLLFPVILVSVAITVLCMFIVMLYTKIKQGVKVSVLIKKCLPSFLTALKAGNIDSSFGLSEYCCVNRLGIDRNYVKAGMSPGLVMYMPANVVGTVLFLTYATISSKISVSPAEMIIAVVMAVILFVATPPIPGANILAYIALVSMLEFSVEFLVLALMFEVIYGVFASSANQFFVQMELIYQSGSIGLLNKEKLRK